jgi:FixJ family two-component response regulator
MSEALIYIVDDDSSVSTALERLLRSAGYRTAAFPSAGEFLARSSARRLPAVTSRCPGCGPEIHAS